MSFFCFLGPNLILVYYLLPLDQTRCFWSELETFKYLPPPHPTPVPRLPRNKPAGGCLKNTQYTVYTLLYTQFHSVCCHCPWAIHCTTELKTLLTDCSTTMIAGFNGNLFQAWSTEVVQSYTALQPWVDEHALSGLRAPVFCSLWVGKTARYLGQHILLSRQHLHLEISVCIVNIAGFIYCRGDSWVFVNHNLA